MWKVKTFSLKSSFFFICFLFVLSCFDITAHVGRRKAYVEHSFLTSPLRSVIYSRSRLHHLHHRRRRKQKGGGRNAVFFFPQHHGEAAKASSCARPRRLVQTVRAAAWSYSCEPSRAEPSRGSGRSTGGFKPDPTSPWHLRVRVSLLIPDSSDSQKKKKNTKALHKLNKNRVQQCVAAVFLASALFSFRAWSLSSKAARLSSDGNLGLF